MGKFPKEDLTGKVFHYLTVLEFDSYRYKHPEAFWKCKCRCGAITYQSSHAMKRGIVKSCGCWKKEMAIKTFTKHGLYNTGEYHIWEGIIQRCTNPNHKAYKGYGGRGISICKEWRESPELFCKWLKDNHWEKGKGFEVDRIDNNKGYTPDNCRVVTRKIQAFNKRSNIWIEFNGQKKTLTQWAKEYGIRYNMIKYRLAHGWSVEDAITKPSKSIKNYKKGA